MLIDVTRLLGQALSGQLPTGIDRVCLEYIRQYGDRSDAVVLYGGRWLQLTRRDSKRLFSGLLAPFKGLKNLIRWIVAKAYLTRFHPNLTPYGFFLNIGHYGLEYTNQLRRLEGGGLQPIFFVHDLIPIDYPEYCRSGDDERHRLRMESVLQLGKGIIANSRVTLDRLTDYAHEHGNSIPPAVVAPLAPPNLPEADTSPPLTEPYFVILSTIEPRKNHWLLLQVWRQLIERLGDRAPHLFIIGRRGWECENVVDLLERCSVLKGFVHELSRCTDKELSTYLYHARALLFPSFAEGYGMPLVEALSIGTPVICSDLSAFREIAGEIPEYVNPLDGLRWEELVLQFSKPDSEKRSAQLQRMQGFIAPTWDDHFQKVDGLMEQIRPEK